MTTTTTTTTKLLKRTKTSEDGGEDRISNLPDTIIQHILSFLPTKYAVSTSVLSSRWKYLWTSIPILDLDDELFYSKSASRDPTTFMNFTDRVLLLNSCSNISKFSLSCKNPNLSRLNSWITTAIIRFKVQHINLYVLNLPDDDDEDPIVFPRCLFTHESLASLTVNMDCAFKLPSYVHFGKLEVLRLCSVSFSSDYLTEQVLFNFPMLHELLIDDFVLVNIKTVVFSTPNLKKLTINDKLDYELGREIKVFAETLMFLTFASYMWYGYSFSGLSSLVEASIYIYECEDSARVTKLLNEVSGVKDLTITVFDGLFQTIALSHHLPHPLLFPYVINLAIIVGGSLLLRDFVSLLHIMPNVESLLITILNKDTSAYEEDGWIPTTMPEGFLSHLKSIKIDGFNGKAEELQVVNFFLERATVMKKMTIVASTNLSEQPKEQLEVTQKLLMLPCGFTRCKIDFSYASVDLPDLPQEPEQQLDVPPCGSPPQMIDFFA